MVEGDKSEIAKREESILTFWKERDIFKKTLAKPSRKGEFVFYEGPPTANGRPGIHHLETRAFKDAIPRYRTMRGYHVRRKAGWDTHGLPVELEVEKELGIKNKKDIEAYGIAKFNKKCKESVLRYIDEWKRFTERIGFWVDHDDTYFTFDNDYIESVWAILKHADERGLLYKDYKVVPWCPRCGTALSSHEVAQGYGETRDPSVYVKFRLRNPEKIGLSGAVYLLAWTTTPWTLPGNVALAVADIEYVVLRHTGPIVGGSTSAGVNRVAHVPFIQPGTYILSKDVFWRNMQSNAGLMEVRDLLGSCREQANDDALHNMPLSEFLQKYEIQTIRGKDLEGLAYLPLFPYLSDSFPDSHQDKLRNAFKVYVAKFVSTDDGTGIVHTAVMYGADDFDLGTKVGLPKHHLVAEDGTFTKDAGPFVGKFVKDADKEIIEMLGERVFRSESDYRHTYPFCWRCKKPLIYYARDSWYIAMSRIKNDLIRENNQIAWEPSHIRDGRFGEWLRELKDWAISRSRFWGTPLPMWEAKDGARLVIGSREELVRRAKSSANRYVVMRHGEAQKNIGDRFDCVGDPENHLTERGRRAAKEGLSVCKAKGITPDIIITSPLVRTEETARIAQKVFGLPDAALITDARLKEVQVGEYDGKTIAEWRKFYASPIEKFSKAPLGGETYADVRLRVGAALTEAERQYSGKTILFVTHDTPAWLMNHVASGRTMDALMHEEDLEDDFLAMGETREMPFVALPRDERFNVDFHRPYIDDVVLEKDGKEYRRVPEVLDVWFDSGAMPLAQDHYPMSTIHVKPGRGWFSRMWGRSRGYPADFICEAIDQTRGWFYTLHAIGGIMGLGKAFKNVICLGHVLDAKGKKMSKSLGNTVEPNAMLAKYGADALRYFMYTVNAPGESKNFDERSIDDIVKKHIGRLANVLAFYKLYDEGVPRSASSTHVLDRWIYARLQELIVRTTDGYERYGLDAATRPLADFIDDLSAWYLRRSRERFKERTHDGKTARAALRQVLYELSLVMAPAMPFFAEHVYQTVREEGDEESVHLAAWPELCVPDETTLAAMKRVRGVVSLALEKRDAAGIKVRQPLGTLEVGTNDWGSEKEHLALIRDEVNVKEVVINPALAEDEVRLDTAITPELREEGIVREFVRAVQEARKKAGLTPGKHGVVFLSLAPEDRPVIERHLAAIKERTNTDISIS